MNLVDPQGRTFKKLRVSLTNTCNLACKYCVPDGIQVENLTKTFVDTQATLQSISSLHKRLSLQAVRLTGGEPMLHPHIEQLIEGIREMGIPKIAMTTNGTTNAQILPKLVSAGLTSINVSLDASSDQTFKSITGHQRYAKVIEWISLCVAMGVEVKLNTVILKGMNEHEILPLLDYSMTHGVELRFLELMRMGKVNSYFEHFYISADEIKEQISSKYKLTEIGRSTHSTTRTYQLANGYEFGMIQNETQPFCSDCDRLRLGSDLKLYGCITAQNGIDISTHLDDELQMTAKLEQALAQKQQVFTGSSKSMIQIGG